MRSNRFITRRASFTRPADTTTYSAGDILGQPFAFALSPKTEARFRRVSLQMAAPVMGAGTRVDFFDTLPTVPPDNAPLTIAGSPVWIGGYDGVLGSARPGGLGLAEWLVSQGFRTETGTIYAVVSMKAGYVPIANEVVTLTTEFELSA